MGNLLDNAAKYTLPGGHIRVALEVDAAGHAVLGVEDNGLGFEADRSEELFGMFFQAPSSAQEGAARAGLGLGLALVRRLIELQGGQAGASSPGPGQGSRFWLRLVGADRILTARAD